ncbi:hypothetical protein HYU22_03535 [Candidatus Woesearchaeota archaeon]|nr:hypothetical protein [Candidatus Woesearchaeota archaeon]
MAKKGEKKPANLDELLDSLKQEHSKGLDESFKAFDAFSNEENQNHLYNNIFYPAQQDLYTGIVQELDKIFGKNDTASVHKKEAEVKRAIVAGLKKYFAKTHPAVTKAIDSLGMDADEAYEHLTSQYDRHVAADGRKIPSITGLVELVKGKKNTVGHVKRQIPELTQKHIEGALGRLQGQYLQHHFSKYHGAEIAGYLKPKLEQEGFEIKDKVGFAQGDLGEMLRLREQYILKKGHQYVGRREERHH